jgi:hypothetical protein
MSYRPAVILKRILLMWWAVWLTVVFVTNLADAGKALCLLPQTWTFASANYQFLAETTARYGTPAWLNGLLFVGVIAWEGAAALLFWLPCVRFHSKGRKGGRAVHAAFMTSLSLWAAFMVADEVFIAYAVEATHLRLFTGQLATLLVIELVPEETAELL